MKKQISLALILSQIALIPTGFCASPQTKGAAPLPAVEAAPTAATTSPEATVLWRMMAIAGEKLPAEQWKQETSAALSEYAASSKPDGREERLEQAFVSLKILSPVQASLMMSQAQAAQAKLAGTTVTTQQVADQTAETVLHQFLQTMPRGAQFAGCRRDAIRLDQVGIGAFLVGLFGILAQGNDVPIDNWAAITSLSGFGLALVGTALSYSCD